MNEKYRLRYAPSPTGYLHIGNTRTALMNFLYAKHYKGAFIIRVEDTDFERNVDGALESQFDNLEWLGITHDESYLKPNNEYGEYIQSQKIEKYYQIALKMVEKGIAYKCYCTPEELEKEKEKQGSKGIIAPVYNGKCKEFIGRDFDKPFNIRFNVPKNKEYIINDIVRDRVIFNSDEIGDFVIVKSNKVATYNFAVVIDDHDMKITHVIRGEEHLSNTPKQIMIYEALSWEIPKFCHLTLIVDETKKKLSKRSPNSVFFIKEYRDKGYLPQAIFNYISLLGWSPKNEEEIYSIDELIKLFTEKNFSKSPSTFDMNKMTWFNNQWMKKISDKEYLDFVKKFINKNIFDVASRQDKEVNNILMLFKNEIDYGIQINDHLDIFNGNKTLSKKLLNLFKSEFSDSIEMIKSIKTELNKLKSFNDEKIKEIIKQQGKLFSLNGKKLFMPIRISTTLSEHGPELAKTISYIGKKDVLKNIDSLIREMEVN